MLKYIAFDCEEGYFIYMDIATKMKSVAQFLNTIFKRKKQKPDILFFPIFKEKMLTDSFV